MLRSKLFIYFLATRLTLTQSLSTTTASPMTTVNLLDLASAAVACTVTASRSILQIVHGKNARLKQDGSVVTDADFAAQGVIVQALQSICKDVRIVGEESAEEMARHIGKHQFLDEDILKRSREELLMRFFQNEVAPLPLAHIGDGEKPKDIEATPVDEEATKDFIVDVSRVTVIVDPLDGTRSYASGDYDSVSILIGLVVDNEPIFGVVGKPFGYTSLTPMLDTGCVTIYGGTLTKGVFVAGGEKVVKKPIRKHDILPKAVISNSRSKGLVHDFCIHLGEQGLIADEPLLVSGAGEKSLRLILQKHNEALWFFPKPGTSRWDVAAPDALLRALGGKLTDRHGNAIDYSSEREEAENLEGVVACIDADLHAECIRLFREGDWVSHGAAALASASPAFVLAERIRLGERVLVFDACGGIGSHVCQIIRKRGASFVVGVSKSTERLVNPRISCDRAIDYNKDDSFGIKEFQDNPFDVLVDFASGYWLILKRKLSDGEPTIVKSAYHGVRFLTTALDRPIYEVHNV